MLGGIWTRSVGSGTGCGILNPRLTCSWFTGKSVEVCMYNICGLYMDMVS
jgi:hypothetical protein